MTLEPERAVNTVELGKASNTNLQMEMEQFPSKPMTSSVIRGQVFGQHSAFLSWTPDVAAYSSEHQRVAQMGCSALGLFWQIK